MRLTLTILGLFLLVSAIGCSSSNKTPTLEIISQDLEFPEDITTADGAGDTAIDLAKDLPMVMCKSNADCAASFDDLGPCEVAVCDSLAGVCLIAPEADGAPCEDGDLCTAGDVCKDGVCVGVDKACTDENDCTTDLCDPVQGCVFEDADGTSCDDGNPCTDQDACTAGECAGEAVSCDDENPCTADSCDALTGCQYDYDDGVECDDLDGCTTDDVCTQGECVGEALECDDGNGCTVDACDPETGCDFQADDGAPCDDGNVCTVGDSCFETECQAGVNECQCEADEDCLEVDDADLCNGTLHCVETECQVDPATVVQCNTTGDTDCVLTLCNPQTGECQAGDAPAGTPCDDGDACTFGESCGQGVCGGGLPLTCDDKNMCTEDKCESDQGCLFVPFSGLFCDDGNMCTQPDVCVEGECIAGTNTCDCQDDGDCTKLSDGNLCDGVWACVDSKCETIPDSQVECEQPDDPCLVALCQPTTGECEQQDGPNGQACDDGDGCTVLDACLDGVCIGSILDCDDANVCTDDWCDPVDGCMNDGADVECDDGNPCTAGDWCVDGQCTPGEDNLCDCETDEDCTEFNGGNLCAGLWVCVDSACQLDLTSIPTCDQSADTQCVKNLCVPETGLCEFTDMPDGTQCDDGVLCTENDVCQVGECAGELLPCDDGNSCTDDICVEGDGCVHLDNNVACDDGDACTLGDLCLDGLCSGSPVLCDDENPCTDDWCDFQQGCMADPADVACDDGSACTDNDWCQAGQCLGDLVDCSDDNDCTDDDCDPLEGCVNYNNADPCDDGDACTVDDMCAAGECLAGPIMDCQDDNQCTDDYCLDGVCQHDPSDGLPCDDGNLCTQQDVCEQASCGGSSVNCDDGNLCTDDECQPDQGCLNQFNNAPCNDANQCTDADTCVLGECQGGPPVLCDDENGCTADSCDSLQGCVYAPLTGESCHDGDACTLVDACVDGKCVGTGAVLCDDGEQCTGDSCDPETGCVFELLTGDACNDGNSCTDADSCSEGHCVGTPTVCDDNDVCTENLCDPTSGCVYPGVADDLGVQCDDGNPCSLASQCIGGVCAGVAFKVCDDQDLCTDDFCSEESGDCATTFNTAPCDDSNPCTEDDTCTQGNCLGGGWMACDDADVCTDDSCQPAQGGCVFQPNSVACDDGDLCTVGDVCQDGQCVPGNNDCECLENEDCIDDGNPCNGTLVCVDNVCLTDPATVVECDDSADTDCKKAACDPSSGACALEDQPDATPCDDLSICSADDQCLAGECVGAALDCSDDNVCTQDLCDPLGGCHYEDAAGACDDADPCTVDDQCDDGVCAGSPFDCEDNNPCTNDQCVVVGGQAQCFYQNNDDPCDDGSVCTEDDICVAGACEGDIITCDDDNLCTDDSCDSADGCLFDPNTLPCDDLDLCTLSDVCGGGQCAGTPKDCSDNNFCTDDTCSSDSGDCVNTPNTLGCDDGDACTEKDVCGGGACVGSPAVCDDGNACTQNLCASDVGCYYPDEANGLACDDQDVCTNGDQCTDGVCGGDDVAGCCNLDSECDDGFPCTADLCVNHACQYGPLDCADENPCTADWCDEGDCQHGSLGLEQAVFFEDFDSGVADGWSLTVANGATEKVYWSVDDQRSYSGDYSLYAGNPDNHSYNHGVGNTTAVTPPVALPPDSPARVTFHYHMLRDPWEWADCNYDYLSVSVESGSVVTPLVPRRCQNTNGFAAASYDLDSYAGQDVKIHFTFATQDNQYNKGEGLYIDDVAILSGPAKGCCDVDGDCGDADECTLDECADFNCEFPEVPGTYFAEDFETGSVAVGQAWNPAVWYLSSTNEDVAWQVDDNRSFNTPYALYGGNLEEHGYDEGAAVVDARTPRIALPAGSTAVLTLQLWMDVQQNGCGNDLVQVLLTTGWNQPVVVATQCATTDGFVEVEADLSDWAGMQVYLTFRFTANGSNNAGEGVYIDHIRIEDKVWDSQCCASDSECDDENICTVDDCAGTPGGGVCTHVKVSGSSEGFDDGAANGWTVFSNNWLVKWQVDGYRSVSDPNSFYAGNAAARKYTGYGNGQVTATTPWTTVPNVAGAKPVVKYSRFLSLASSDNHCLTVTLQRQWPSQSVQLEKICGKQDDLEGWVQASFELDAYLGANVRVQFVFSFQGGGVQVNPPEGVYIDDFLLGIEGCL